MKSVQTIFRNFSTRELKSNNASLSFSVITCPVIAAPSQGMVSPVECEKSLGLNYKTECYFACNLTNGYQLEGPKSISCLENGSWSADVREVICKGITDAGRQRFNKSFY